MSEFDRRALARRLSRIFNTEPLAALSVESVVQPSARRLGFSGPPGAGKSSLIARWSGGRLARGRRIGVLAVDPSSPVSQGCVLGDRVRMDGVTDHPGFYMRSLASRSLHDGLCPNVATLMDELCLAGFDDVVLETVGVGQTDYALRSIVDTFVMVLNPDGGDVVQAMKAGILEVADVLVVNKADFPAAKRMSREVASIVDLRVRSGWRPPVIEVSALLGTGMGEFESAIDAHAAFLTGLPDDAGVRSALRQRYRLQTAIEDGLTRVLNDWPLDRFGRPLTELLADAIEELRSAARETPSNAG